MDYILQMQNIVKEFSSVRVLDHVNLQVRAGEIHALCGENGAGKSTLMKILSGAYPYGTFEGTIMMEGRNCTFHNTKESSDVGIEIIYQELEVAPNMTVAENIFLGCEPCRHGLIDYDYMNRESAQILERLKINIDPLSLVADLGVGMRQMVVIAKALLRQPKVLVMDEPSAALTEIEVKNMLSLVKKLASEGVAVVYISHRLEEVLEISDTITILRDGKTVITEPRSKMDAHSLIKYMVGRELSDQFIRSTYQEQEVIFEISHLSAIDELTGKQILKDISFEVKRGEIVGLAGLMGAGRTETALAVMKALPNAQISGEIRLEGQKLHARSPGDMIRQGVFLVVEDRKEKGLVLE